MRSRWQPVVFAFLLIAPWAVAAWVWVTDPPNRPFTAFAAVYTVFVIALVWRRHALEGPELVEYRCRVWRRAVDLRQARSVVIRGNNGGQAILRVADRARRSGIVVALQSNTDELRAARDPDQLEALAKALGGAPATGAGGAVRLLRAQAAHLRSGGSLETAPLARLSSNRFGNTARTAGGAGSIGNLLD
jgi:hypothetical protein